MPKRDDVYLDHDLVLRGVLALERIAQALEEQPRAAAPPRAVRAQQSVTIDGPIPKCPACGGVMRHRNRRADGAPFWGCAAFPNCPGIVNIDGAFTEEDYPSGDYAAPPARGKIEDEFPEFGDDDVPF